jgi:predicted enzyme related to lactoylglutathione lyase
MLSCTSAGSRGTGGIGCPETTAQPAPNLSFSNICYADEAWRKIMDLHSIAKITLRSSDFARTERFYHELFGWKFHQYSATYLGFEPPSGISGGFQKRDIFSQGDSYLMYILVDEFESYLQRIPQLGVEFGVEIEIVSENSQYIRVYDPDGNRLALWRNISSGNGVNK